MEQRYNLVSANQEALKLYSIGEYKKALDLFDKILQANPNFEAAMINKGLCLDAMEDFQGALQCYEKVIENSTVIQEKEPSDVFYFKGIALYYLSTFEEAMEAFSKDIEYNGTDIDQRSTIFLSLCCFHLKDYDNAMIYIDGILEITSTHIDALNNRGACLIEMGKTTEAREVFEKMTQLDDLFAPAYFNLGIIAQQQDDIDQARQYFTRVQTLDADYIGIEEAIKSIS